MNIWASRVGKVAQYAFLAAIALLIVRNNNYPWPIKRSSDMLFLASALFACAEIIILRDWEILWANIKFLTVPSGLILGGLAAASVYATVIHASPLFNSDGILAFSRFAEALLIATLCVYFQMRDTRFIRRAAGAQLSTLIYIPFLFGTYNTPQTVVPRFQMLENFPSNVGYYLVVSISAVVSMAYMEKKRIRKIVCMSAAAGYSAILLWTQSRASMLGVVYAIGAVLIIGYWKLGWSWQLVIKNTLVGIGIALAGFLLLPKGPQQLAIARFYPQNLNPYENSTRQFLTEAATQKIPTVTDPSRIYLWKTYARKILKHPLGMGVLYEPELYEGSIKGPHNIELEMLIMTGVFGLVGFVLFIWYALRQAYAAVVREPFLATYVLAALIGLLVAAQFDDMSTFRTLWVVVGLGLALRSTIQPSQEKFGSVPRQIVAN